MPLPPPSLLLLPSPPSPPTRAALSAAYRAPLASVLEKLHTESTKTSSSASSSVLVVAVTGPILTNSSASRARFVQWSAAQSLLAGLYTIVAAICAEQGIESYVNAGPGSVDVRIVLVDHDKDRKYEKDTEGKYAENSTCVPTLANFAVKVHPWQSIYHTSCEAGYQLLSTFLDIIPSSQIIKHNQIIPVQGGLTISTGQLADTTKTEKEEDTGYGIVCLGGTFDHLHPGHKLLLHAVALLLSVPDDAPTTQGQIVIGISGDNLLKKKKFAEQLESWHERARHVLEFLSTIFNTSPTTTDLSTTIINSDVLEMHGVFCGGSVLVRCVDLQDPFGPTTSEQEIEAIVVSGETRSGGAAINERRIAKDWKPLQIYEIDVLDADADETGDDQDTEKDNFESKMSSTVIRQKIAEATQRSQ